MTRLALTRPVGRSIARCALSFLERTPIDLGAARQQHEAYERALVSLGCVVHRLPAADDLPDGVFVEDAAVVLDEIGIVTRPGAASRRAEVPTVARALAELRPLAVIEAPATLDGGDVLRVGRTLFVGQSGRTNAEGIESLKGIAEPLGYRVIPVELDGCLHLKSAASWLGRERLLVDPARVALERFSGMDLVHVPEDETPAANVLVLGNTAIIAAGFPRTRELLEESGLNCIPVVITELAKAEGGLTCCSLIVENDNRRSDTRNPSSP
jgi:dimethylargininase